MGDLDAQWAGIGTGWYYSVLGGGYYKRSSLPPVTSQRTPLYFDNTYEDRMRGDFAVPTVFNGNFDAIKYKIDNQPIPGWSIHNGNGVSVNDVEDETLQQYLVDWKDIPTLSQHYKTGVGYDGTQPNYALHLSGVNGIDEAPHNRLFMPDWGALRFNLHVPETALDKGVLSVILEDANDPNNFAKTTISFVKANGTNASYAADTRKLGYATKGFETFQLDNLTMTEGSLDNLRGRTVIPKFKLLGSSAEAYIDDVAFQSIHPTFRTLNCHTSTKRRLNSTNELRCN